MYLNAKWPNMLRFYQIFQFPYDSFIKYSITQIKIMYIAALNKYFFLHSLLESVNVLFRSLAFLRSNEISFIDALSTYHKSSSFAKSANSCSLT